ncbi:site-specific integrase [Microbacterium sp. NPDC078814]|uniref:tyrosine-type recombinase/integrase n=1 Tax=Microbacterium sp. NPDC078814 TaxID=3154767 RepID=UPI0034502BFC
MAEDSKRTQRAPSRGKGEGAVFQDSRGLWTAVLELPSQDGKTRRRKYIRAKSKPDLMVKFAKARRELEDRGDLDTNVLTVEQWFTYWLEQVAAKRVRPATLNGYKSVVKAHIIPGLRPGTKLDKITAATIRRVHASALNANGSSTYALNAHRIMSASFEVAVREGRLFRNPAKLVEAPRRAVTSLDVLTKEEVREFIARARATPGGTRWIVSVLTGARRGEVIGLERDRVGDVLDLSWQLQRLPGARDGNLVAPADFEYRHIRGGLYWTRPKSKAGWRIIPLVEPLRTYLLEHLESEPENPWGLVFTEDGRPRDPDRDTKAWNRFVEDIFPGRNVRLHDLRHTAVDMLYEAGVPEDLMIEIVGHSTRTMTRAYKTRGNIDRLRIAMSSFGELVTPPADGPARTLETGGS